jgi:hypothetical protein
MHFAFHYEEKVFDHLDVLTRKHKRSIDIFLEEKLMDIRLLAKTNRFADLTDQTLSISGSMSCNVPLTDHSLTWVL